MGNALFCPLCAVCKNMTRNTDGGYCRMFYAIPTTACDYYINERAPSDQYLDHKRRDNPPNAPDQRPASAGPLHPLVGRQEDQA